MFLFLLINGFYGYFFEDEVYFAFSAEVFDINSALDLFFPENETTWLVISKDKNKLMAIRDKLKSTGFNSIVLADGRITGDRLGFSVDDTIFEIGESQKKKHTNIIEI